MFLPVVPPALEVHAHENSMITSRLSGTEIHNYTRKHVDDRHGTRVCWHILDALPRGNGGLPARITCFQNEAEKAFFPHRGPARCFPPGPEGGLPRGYKMSNLHHLRLAVWSIEARTRPSQRLLYAICQV